MTGTLSTPSAGSPRSTEEPKIATAVTTLNGLLTSSNTLDGAQLGAGTVANAALAGSITAANLAGSIGDPKLSSPNNSVYKTLIATPISYIGTATAAAGAKTPNASGTWTNNPSVSGAAGFPLFDFASGDFSVGSLTTQFRVKMQVFVGTTSPSTVTFNAGLYPITSASDSLTFGTVVTGSTTGTTATPSLATNTISRYASSEFAASALLSNPGLYTLAVVIGSITVPANIAVALQLQTRNT